MVNGLEELLELTVEQSNLYAHQNERNFTVTKEEQKAFLGINIVMAINKLSMIAEYWRVNNLIGNDRIQNKWFEIGFVRSFKINILQIKERTMKQTRFSRWDQWTRPPKFEFFGGVVEWYWVTHWWNLKEIWNEVYIKSKPINWSFKVWFRCSSKVGYLY